MSSWLSKHSLNSSKLKIIIILLITNLFNLAQLSFFPRPFQSIIDLSTDSPDRKFQTPSSNPAWPQIASAFRKKSHALPKPSKLSSPEHSRDSELLDKCMSRPLSPRLWNELGMNEFLRNYPFGNVLSLPQLANRVNLTNFDCGIQRPCFAEQLCRPVRGKEWYILVAAQEWNSFMNTIYKAIGLAMTMIQGVGPSLVQDFYPDCPDSWAITKAVLILLSSVAKVIPTEGIAPGPKWLYQLFQGEMGLYAGVANVFHDVLSTRPVNQHDKWTKFSYALSKNQELAQMSFAGLSQKIIESGISTDGGMYGVLKDGYFLMDHCTPRRKLEFNIAGDKQEELKIAVQLNLLASLWKEQKYFITRGSDPCTNSGPNGAWSGTKVLSYCGSDNIMMNIIQAKGKHAINKVHHANLVEAKYNFTVGFLTQSAWNCQKRKRKDFAFGVWDPESSNPITFDDYCSFDLPVCDLTRDDIRAYRDSGAGTVQACRVVGGLPI